MRFLCFMLWVSAAQADVTSNMNSFFQSLGSSVQGTSGGVYQDQAAGYYTGGRLFVRNTVKDVNPMTLQMPGYRAGCGGIDLFTGGLSFVKTEDFVRVLRSVGQNAVSYAFMLALQTVSPQIYNTIEYINEMAQKINQTNINSCEIAATLLGGAWPRTDQSSKHLCSAMGSQLGTFSDWAEARQQCGAGGKRQSTLSRKAKGFENTLTPPYNLVWEALQQKSFLKESKELASVFLSLSGSLIVGLKGEEIVVQTLPSLAHRGTLVQALLYGGQTKVYTCNGEKCLAPKLSTIRVPEKDSLFFKVSQTTQAIIDKIYEDKPLTESEKSFLNLTTLPVYKMLNVSTAYRRGESPLDVQQYTQLIAFDIVLHYIQEVLSLVHQAVSDLKSAQVSEDHMTEFLVSLDKVRRHIAESRQSSLNHLHATVSLIEKTQLLEKQLHAMMGTAQGDLS